MTRPMTDDRLQGIKPEAHARHDLHPGHEPIGLCLQRHQESGAEVGHLRAHSGRHPLEDGWLRDRPRRADAPSGAVSRMDGRPVLVVANSTDPDAGYVGERFVERGHPLRTVLRDRVELPDDLAGVAAVLLLGSDWSVHSPVDLRALEAESDLVRGAYASSVPVLGICYGAQVLAHAFGGRVSAATLPEVGFVEVSTEDEDLVPSGPWAAFHLDVVEAPPDARVVAVNGCGTQAFLLPGVLAVQFHPEVRPHVLDDWSRRFPDLLDDAGLSRTELVDEARRREPAARAAAHALVDAFLDRVAAPAPS